MEPGALWIANRWQTALSGATFTSATGATWAQAGQPELRHALDAAHDAATPWRARAESQRGELVQHLARALAVDAGLLDGLARHLGLAPAELALHRQGLEEELASSPVATSQPVALLLPDWRTLVRGLVRELARELVAGRSVVVVSDARAPELAAGLARAALVAGLPPGVVNVLHGPARELASHALTGARGEVALVASGSGAHVVELRRLCDATGAGEARLTTLRAGAWEVEPNADLALAVAEVLERAFGRASTLGGQLPGSLARVHVPARAFSRFSELLMAALGAGAFSERPLLQIDREAAEAAHAAWALGLDEGATLIAGGEELAGAEGQRAALPTVLTNVEPFMSSARRQEPLPVLCLMRA